MTVSSAAALWVGLWLLVAAIARSSVGARLARLLLLPLLALPWWLAGLPQQRLVFAYALMVLLASAFDFMTARRPASFAGRLGYMLAFAAMVDATSAVKVRRRLDQRAACRTVGALVVVALAVGGWIAVAWWPDSVRVPLRLAAAIVLILAVAEVHRHLTRLLSTACGVEFAETFAQPLRSRTLTEFWSERWNRLGARWFRQHGFVPLRSRGVTLALFSLFGLSAAGHAYLIAAGAAPAAAAMWAAFFLVQAPLIIAERRLQVRRWPPLASHAWTVAVFGALSPLFFVPVFDAFALSL